MFHVPNLLTTLAHCDNRGHVANPNPRRKCANIHSFDSWSKLVAFVATILPEAALAKQTEERCWTATRRVCRVAIKEKTPSDFIVMANIANVQSCEWASLLSH